MIVRIYRARVIRGQEERFLQFLRDEAMPFIEQSGAVATYFGRRIGPLGEDFVAISVWPDLDTLERAVPEWRSPIAFPQVRSLVTDDYVEHYESVPTTGPAPAGEENR
jgi:hypothetical protein